MNDPISILKSICELVIKGKDLLKKHFPNSIQKELLRAAAQSGEFYIIQADQLVYPIIRAGGKDMGDENDPASLAAYYDAFKALCSNGYIEPVAGRLFHLTKGGIEKARRLT